MKIKRLLLLTVLSFLLIPALTALGELKLPEPQGHVNDYQMVLSRQNRADLELQLVNLEKKTGDEVAVVLVDSLQGTTVEDYAVRLFEKWKIGKKGKDNGVLFLVALQDRKVRIEVGYGLEPKLTDVQASKIIRDSITPKFQTGDFDKGVKSGVDQIVLAIAGKDYVSGGSTPEGSSEKTTTGGIIAALSVLFFLGAGAVIWLVSVLARSKSWWAGGVIGAVIGLVILAFSGWLIGILAIIGLTAVGLALDFAVSKGYNEHSDRGSKPPWWAGGMWAPGGGVFGDFGGGSGGDGGGFGGFGGGSSGGGGASGGW